MINGKPRYVEWQIESDNPCAELIGSQEKDFVHKFIAGVNE